jgi:hypothetical protein
MKINTEQLEYAILYFAEKFNKKRNYIAILSNTKEYSKIIRMIVYDMFLFEFNAYSCTTIEYDNYKTIYDYAIELDMY